MPLYEYECFVCSRRFERIQKTTAAPVTECPECGGAVRRLLSAPALQFKGSGWYVTDYGKGTGGRAGAQMPDSSDSPKSDSGDPKSSSSETKGNGTEAATAKDTSAKPERASATS